MGKKHAKRKLRQVTFYSPETPDWISPQSPNPGYYESPYDRDQYRGADDSPGWMYRDSPDWISPDNPGTWRMPRSPRAYCEERHRSCLEGCRRYYARGDAGRYRGCSVRCMTNYMYCDGTPPYPRG
jgi:hypothetical protein